MPAPTDNILEQFILDEAAALQRKEQGSFYPDNHHIIKPLAAKANKLLSPALRIELYFHLLRLDFCPPVKTSSEFEALSAAYTRALPLDRGYAVCGLSRPKGLFLFGRNSHGLMDGEPVESHETYAKHLTAWRYLDGFHTCPACSASGPNLPSLEKTTH